MAIKIPRDDQSSINLTPLIDIVFLLIIFFMVGTRFSELNEAEKNIALQIPQVTDAKAMTAAPRKRVINVFEDGRIMLDETEVSLDVLYENLSDAKKQYRKLGVVVRGDGQSLYQNVARVIATCKRAEVADVNIAVKVNQLR